MFWCSSSAQQEYGCGGSEGSESSDLEEASWTRPSRIMHSSSATRRYRRSANPKPWFWNLFSSTHTPEKSKKRSSKKSRKTKARFGMHFRPQSSQEWGLLFLTILLFVYLVDFFNLLYKDSPRRTGVGFRNSVQSQLQKTTHAALPTSQLQPPSTIQNGAENRGLLSSTNRNLSQANSLSSGEINGSTKIDAVREQPQQGAPTANDQTSTEAVMKAPEEHNSELPQHPMNRNMVELQVPGKTGTLSTESVKEYYRKLAKAYLGNFQKGIYRQMYFDVLRRRTYSLTPPGANKGVQTILFQVIDNKVYMMDPYEVPRNSKPFYRTRINQVIWLLSKLVGQKRIKNTEFLMAIHDCVQTVNKPHTYRGAHYQESNPAFTIVSCNFSDNIPFPMWEGSKHRDGGFSGWDETMKKYAVDDVAWEKKQDRAVFRGGNRPSMYFMNKTDADSHCHDVGRTRLQYLSQQQPDVLDVSIGGTCGGERSMLDRLEPHEHHKYKYILYAEGNCMWADRMRTQVFGPSTIIKQETPCGQFFEPLLRPNAHYIPTDFFFTDTVSRVLWARENDDKAREIVQNANEFAHNFLTLKGIESYVEVLLEEYTKLLVEPDVKLENGAIDVTDKRV